MSAIQGKSGSGKGKASNGLTQRLSRILGMEHQKPEAQAPNAQAASAGVPPPPTAGQPPPLGADPQTGRPSLARDNQPGGGGESPAPVAAPSYRQQLENRVRDANNSFARQSAQKELDALNQKMEVEGDRAETQRSVAETRARAIRDVADLRKEQAQAIEDMKQSGLKDRAKLIQEMRTQHDNEIEDLKATHRMDLETAQAKDRKDLKRTAPAGVATASSAPQSKAISSKAASDPGFDADAWNYGLTGHLPSTGYGKDAAKFKVDVVQRWRQLVKEIGLDPPDIVALRGGVAADKSSLAKMTWLDASVNQFEDTLQGNLKIAENLNEKYDRTDVKFVNRIENWYRGQRNDPAVNNFMAQIQTLAPEYAKIMAGSTSAAGATVRGTEDAQALFDKTLSQGGFQALIDGVIKPDLANRKAALSQAKSGLLDRLRGRNAARSVGASGAPGGSGGQSPTGKPGSLEDFYKKYPDLRPK